MPASAGGRSNAVNRWAGASLPGKNSIAGPDSSASIPRMLVRLNSGRLIHHAASAVASFSAARLSRIRTIAPPPWSFSVTPVTDPTSTPRQSTGV